jgi:hypothetical protein
MFIKNRIEPVDIPLAVDTLSPPLSGMDQRNPEFGEARYLHLKIPVTGPMQAFSESIVR